MQVLPLIASFRAPTAHFEVPVPEEFRSLRRRAAELRHVDTHLPTLEPQEVLARLGGPCALVSNVVIPLESIADGATVAGCLVRIDGRMFRLAEERARRLQEALRDLQQEAQARARRGAAADPAVTASVEAFLAELRSLLARFRPRSCGRHQLLYTDPDHQLHHGRGHSMLVRGPAVRRTGGGSLFVGLLIKGATRAELLAVAPRPSPTAEGLWTPRGDPAQGGGICMGKPAQYKRLYSPSFTTAEAVVQKLDAAVILVTGRSDFHRRWRAARRARRPGAPRSSRSHDDHARLENRALLRAARARALLSHR
jgi:hypothetical protein